MNRKILFIAALFTLTTLSPLRLEAQRPGLFSQRPAQSTQIIKVNTEPAGAKITNDGLEKRAVSPATIVVSNRQRSLTITFRNKGYKKRQIIIPGSYDPVKGYIYPEEINYSFRTGNMFEIRKDEPIPVSPPANDPTIPTGEANNMVNRDAPGQTALERTILRWRIDSDPRGARIFYRVISSIPEIVKNTNETYLMTTPFEETRAFNILGLTYENSRDVQIEFKVTKIGYEDQIKRFNVRQAIDQQEISSFFELVPKTQ